jgi:hypothetical protein
MLTFASVKNYPNLREIKNVGEDPEHVGWLKPKSLDGRLPHISLTEEGTRLTIDEMKQCIAELERLSVSTECLPV